MSLQAAESTKWSMYLRECIHIFVPETELKVWHSYNLMQYEQIVPPKQLNSQQMGKQIILLTQDVQGIQPLYVLRRNKKGKERLRRKKKSPATWCCFVKGMLLSFDDRTGKSWRFHYSYWNSSQRFDDWTGKSRKEQRLRRKEKLPAMEHTLQGRSSLARMTNRLRWAESESGSDNCSSVGGEDAGGEDTGGDGKKCRRRSSSRNPVPTTIRAPEERKCRKWRGRSEEPVP